jgi:VanZ family protein
VRRALPFAPAAVWAAVLIWLGGSTNLPATPPVLHLDKALHFGAYGVLGALLGFGWLYAARRPPWAVLLGLAVLLGGIDELRQARIVEREADWADWIADAVGATVGFYVALRIVRRPPERLDDE